MKKLIELIKEHKDKIKYCTSRREKFYDLAGHYLPTDNNALVVDIGCGNCQFASQLDLYNKYNNLCLLDSTADTINNNKSVEHYTAPERLPLDDGAVDFIHCSHLIEHLDVADIRKFLLEINRVLKDGGMLVVSAPLLFEYFYGDLTHVRPYNPEVFSAYLVADKRNKEYLANPTGGKISNNFDIKRLVYRYNDGIFEGWGSKFLIIDLAMKIIIKALYVLGFRKFKKSGYTIVLQKNNIKG
jgi:SAM-dependent methyltransferase